MKERIFKNLVTPYNNCGPYVKVVQFQMKNLNDFRKWIVDNNGVIDREKSREESYKHNQHLIDIGNYDYFNDEENGTPFDELPKKDQEKLYGYCRGHGKWSKWTAEKLLERDGWEKDEVYWFSLQKDNTYDYQLILREGDFVCREAYEPNHRPFYTIGSECRFEHSSEWKEIKE